MEGKQNCTFIRDAPFYRKRSDDTRVRKPGEECLKPYRDGVKKNEDAKFLRECAELFRTSDPSRAARLDEIAGRTGA